MQISNSSNSSAQNFKNAFTFLQNGRLSTLNFVFSSPKKNFAKRRQFSNKLKFSGRENMTVNTHKHPVFIICKWHKLKMLMTMMKQNAKNYSD